MSIYTDVQDSAVFKARTLEFGFKPGSEPYDKLLNTFANIVKDDILTWQNFDIGPPIALDKMGRLYENFVADKLISRSRAAAIFTEDRDALFTLAGTILPDGANTPVPTVKIVQPDHKK